MRQVLCINTAGEGDLHELRARRLSQEIRADVTHFNVNRGVSRAAAVREVWSLLKSRRWDLVYQESTGIAGGAALIRAARTRRQRFVVSSGDPIGGFFRVTEGPVAGALFGAYEKALYRSCAGFIGWTPYLAGMALSLGARRAVTIEGAVDTDIFRPYPEAERAAVKQRLGLNPQHLVCGIVGSLRWTPRQSYCYGLELVETLKRATREDVSVLIVGDGEGRARLQGLLPDALRPRVVFTGRLPQDDVVGAMNAMDIGFIPQTLDHLGSYRLTTKLPEYLACGLPVAMSPIPGFFDYVSPSGWALPPFHPASPAFHARCAEWLDELSWDEVRERASRARETALTRFDYAVIGPKFRDFIHGLLDER